MKSPHCVPTQIFSTAELAAVVLTTSGIVTLFIGIIVMPTLELSEAGFYLGLLNLVGFMVLCYGVGQLAILRERYAQPRRFAGEQNEPRPAE